MNGEEGRQEVKSTVNTAVVLSGGNMGDTKALIDKACRKLEILCQTPIRRSSFCVSEPWGFDAAQFFYNQVWVFETAHTAEQLLDHLLHIEQEAGRQRIQQEGYASRTLDLDLLFLGQQMIQNDKITVPHPRLHLRRFTLLPLVEVIPDFIHPTFLCSLAQLLEQCSDPGHAQLEKP
ncbi:MAG TPA: 2-amino-4-hydroxy-6-hydroxymethyldihydropteridine diphosphokinase [Luteibaculaceae bacterium]|nr:2-amino-4-hydroxy-6-hydroxymethyldihydropteridine diphosphokinase [Luteibaculaceae bacterium]